MYISTISTLSYTDLPGYHALLLTENHYLIKLATSVFLTKYDTACVSGLQFGDDWKSLFVPPI
jgi:hypothetical protein